MMTIKPFSIAGWARLPTASDWPVAARIFAERLSRSSPLKYGRNRPPSDRLYCRSPRSSTPLKRTEDRGSTRGFPRVAMTVGGQSPGLVGRWESFSVIRIDLSRGGTAEPDSHLKAGQ